MVVPGRLWLKTQFPLMPNRQNAYLILGSHESIQGDIARLTVGNDQLAQFTFHAPADQGVRGQDLDGRLDRRDCVQRGARVLVTEKLKRTVNVIQRARRVDYLRHGFGRATASRTASRLIQACTSSPR